uniref:Mpv17-like protein 2 n=1 Tax=Eptatretus burgeri TaxID=7764 RepID=A0A8C4R4H8_EPTBU
MAGFAQLFRGRLLLLTNTLASGTMMAIGDALEQGREAYVHCGTLEEHQYNWSRTRNMLTVGCFQGSFAHAWYSWLDRQLPGKSVRTVARKVSLDCIVASPFFITTYILGLGTLDRQSFGESWKEIKQKFLTYILADWLFWPPVQTVNFLFVPAKFRVLGVCLSTIIFDTFLSYLKYQYGEKQPEKLQQAGIEETTKEILPSSTMSSESKQEM